MSTPLLQQFPSLASPPPSFLKDLLSSPQLTEAYLFTLPAVQEMVADIERLGKENEERARESMFALALSLSLRSPCPDFELSVRPSHARPHQAPVLFLPSLTILSLVAS